MILLTLLKARQVSEARASASKITPIVVIEEPESFLHPSAQAEFGRLLQVIAEEFRIQVVATTHSPYMLSQTQPESNILLERRIVRGQQRETIRRETAGSGWMLPFGAALGIDNAAFEPWKEALFGQADSILLVEGDIDAEYFTMLRDSVHGANALVFEGDILPYDGRDALKNTVLLKFLKSRFPKVFITFDLDSMSELKKPLEALGLTSGQDYLPIGVDQPGKRSVEGLLPEIVRSTVFGQNVDLVQQALQGTGDEKRVATRRLKRLLLEEFKNVAKPGDEHFKAFYSACRTINRALKS
jgi:hypothetical protein